jgi:hypothetical protein
MPIGSCSICPDLTEICVNLRDAFGRFGNAPKIFIDIILTDLVTSAETEKSGRSISVLNCVAMMAIGSSKMPHRTDITARISFLFGTNHGANSIT